MRLIKINRIIALLNTVKVDYDDEFEGLCDEVQRNKERYKASYEFYKELEILLEAGVIVKDLEEGLVDFYSSYDGREILLCWKLGEERVGFWHEVGRGYAYREPLLQEGEKESSG